MSRSTRLLLVRHLATAAGARGRFVGRLDLALAPSAAAEAAALARALAPLPIEAVYSSPAGRALETATPLAAAHGLAPIVEERLAEIDFGILEGRTYAEAEREQPELYARYLAAPTAVAFPGGESYGELRGRTLAALAEVRSRHDGATVALVAHAGPLRAIVADCLALPDVALFRLDHDHGAVALVEWPGAGAPGRVRLLNGTAAAAARMLGGRAAAGGEGGAPASGALERPPLPSGYDDSRARDRGAHPDGWRFAAGERAAVWRAILERRDIRRFRPQPLPPELVTRLLEAAHRAPSVGLMQPWRFVVVESDETKAAMQALAARERLVQAGHFGERARAYLDLKIEGIREAPLGICVCCDRDAGGPEVLGRHTIRDTDLYSTCLAIENLWLLARAEGVGVGWVSFYRPEDLQALLGLPAQVVPVAWLCVGYPDERPRRPGLEAAGWQQRAPLEQVVHAERWCAAEPTEPVGERARAGDAATAPSWWGELAGRVPPADQRVALAVRDASDELVKPSGSLGWLETVAERLAAAAGASPPARLRAGILVLAADHGVAARDVSLFPARVGAQVAAAAARGETAIGVLARALDAELVVADVGLRGPRLPGLIDRRVAEGSADVTLGAALTDAELRAAVEAGYELAAQLARDRDILVVGEIGIGNTTAAAALLAALLGLPAAAVCGRGTGLDAQGLARKRAVVAEALARNAPPRAQPLECLRRVGGLELAALCGALVGAAAARRPVVLDGFATGVAALTATRLQPLVRDYLLAGHRSAEPAHGRVLTELGLEPLLDLRLRLGEGSGAALALPLIGLAAQLQREMSRFAEAGVERAVEPRP